MEQGVLAGHRGKCPDFPHLVGVRGVSRAELFVILEDPAVCEPGDPYGRGHCTVGLFFFDPRSISMYQSKLFYDKKKGLSSLYRFVYS